MGGSGSDELNGGGANDVLTGGADADTFVFSGPIGGVDRVKNFEIATDVVLLDSAYLTMLSAGALSAANFALGAAADADGSGAGAAAQFATFDLNPLIAATDFFIV